MPLMLYPADALCVQARELEGMALAAEQKAAVAAANRREQAMYERRKGEIQESIEQARACCHGGLC